MISIFGPKSFNSFMALKKFAICFRQHPMVTMWQTLFSTNFFEISFTKHIFSSFQNTIRYAKRQQKLLFLFTPRSQFVSRDERNAFKKYHLTSQKCFFFLKVDPQPKNFSSQLVTQCVLFLKRKCSLFDNLSKSEHCLFHSF